MAPEAKGRKILQPRRCRPWNRGTETPLRAAQCVYSPFPFSRSDAFSCSNAFSYFNAHLFLQLTPCAFLHLQHSERLPLSPCCPQHVHQAATILLLLIFVSGWGPPARPQPLPASARTGAARPGGWCLIFQGMTHGEMPASSAKNFKQRLFKKGIEESNHLSRGETCWFLLVLLEEGQREGGEAVPGAGSYPPNALHQGLPPKPPQLRLAACGWHGLT